MINRALKFSFLIVFMAGGWSPLLAAAFCSHGDCGRASHGLRSETATLMQKHHAAAQSNSHHPCHEGMASTEVKRSSAPPLASNDARSFHHIDFLQLTNLGNQCGHCLTRSPTPGVDPLRIATLNSRRLHQHETAAPAAFAFAARILPEIASFPARGPTQGAPPAFLQRLDRQRHLLLVTFLI